MKNKKTIELTPIQLADLIACVSHNIERNKGFYGPVTRQTEALLEANRSRLLEKLKLALFT